MCNTVKIKLMGNLSLWHRTINDNHYHRIIPPPCHESSHSFPCRSPRVPHSQPKTGAPSFAKGHGAPVGPSPVHQTAGNEKNWPSQHQATMTGELLYQTLEQDQHCLTCLQCGESFPIQGCPVQSLEENLQANYSFRIYYHTLEFFGLCQLCAKGSG